MIYVNGELHKLKQPIILKMLIQDDNSYVLANEEFSSLISCNSIAEGLEEGRRMFEEDYALYTNPENQVHLLGKKTCGTADGCCIEVMFHGSVQSKQSVCCSGKERI